MDLLRALSPLRISWSGWEFKVDFDVDLLTVSYRELMAEFRLTALFRLVSKMMNLLRCIVGVASNAWRSCSGRIEV